MEQTKVTFSPVEKDLLYLKISDTIYAYIKQNNLKEGDKLPSEREMAKMFQTGRNSVREALRVLENSDIIEVKTGKGTYVKSQANTSSTFQLSLVNCEFHELLELKNTVEDQAIRDAIRYATDEEKTELVSMATQMENLANKGMYSNTLDHKFHRRILELSKNKVFKGIAMNIRENHFIRQWEDTESDSARWLPSVPFHVSLAKAIKDGDEECALAMQKGINDYVNCVDNAERHLITE